MQRTWSSKVVDSFDYLRETQAVQFTKKARLTPTRRCRTMNRAAKHAVQPRSRTRSAVQPCSRICTDDRLYPREIVSICRCERGVCQHCHRNVDTHAI